MKHAHTHTHTQDTDCTQYEPVPAPQQRLPLHHPPHRVRPGPLRETSTDSSTHWEAVGSLESLPVFRHCASAHFHGEQARGIFCITCGRTRCGCVLVRTGRKGHHIRSTAYNFVAGCANVIVEALASPRRVQVHVHSQLNSMHTRYRDAVHAPTRSIRKRKNMF